MSSADASSGRADLALGFGFILLGAVSIAIGTIWSVPIALLVGLIAVVFGWTKIHSWIAPQVQGATQKFFSRPFAPWITLVVLGTGLLIWSVAYEGLLALQVAAVIAGVWIGAKGVGRLGLEIRQRIARSDSGLIGPWGLIGVVLLAAAVYVLATLGMSLWVALGSVLILSTAIVLLVTFGRGPVLVGGSIAVGIWLVIWLFGYTNDARQLDPHPEAESRVLVAMGDSYMSGEGAARYFEGTNRRGENECRRTSTAYAYLVAGATDRSLVFLACSGATTANVLKTEQFPGIGRQITSLRSVRDRLGPGSAVIISIGGNDAGFGEIGRTCLVPGSCRLWAEQWLRNIQDRVETQIGSVLRQVRTVVPEDVPVFAVTYPVVLTEQACRWSPLSDDEHSFLATELTVELNEAVRFAASDAGVEIIDLEDALKEESLRICDRLDPQNSAINVFGMGPVEGSFLDRINPTRWFHSSLHPNEEGHKIFALLVASALNRDTQPSDDAPASGDGRRGRDLPRLGEDRDAMILLEEPRTNDASECDGVAAREHLLTVFNEATDPNATGTQRIWGAEPGSAACYRDSAGVWQATMVNDQGALEVPWEFPTRNEPIEAAYTRADDEAIAVEFVFCAITPTRCPVSGTSDWVVEQLLLLISALVLAWALLAIGVATGVGAIGGLKKSVLEGPSSQPVHPRKTS